MKDQKWFRFKLLMVIMTASILIIGAVQKFDTIHAKKIVITGSGGFELGNSSGSFDLNGKEMTLDADDDSSITCDTDDQCEWELGGQDEYVLTAAIFDIGEGTLTRIDLDANNDTSIRSSAPDQIDLELGGSDAYTMTATNFYFNGKILTLDSDIDTTVDPSADDIITVTLGAATGHVDIATGNLKVGNGTPGQGLNGEDVYIEGTLEVDSLAIFDGVISQTIGTENFGQHKTILSQVITFTAAAGGSGTLATITDGEIWFVHKIFIRTTTNFDATGDDVTFVIGDGNDPNGFISAIDANLQAAFTEATGYAAGWFGVENGSGGAYTLDDGGPFVYAPSGADETIDWLLDETSGETITAGQLTTYIEYTRIQ